MTGLAAADHMQLLRDSAAASMLFADDLADVSLPDGAAVPLSKVLAAFAEFYRCKFSYLGNPIGSDVIFAGEMLLPAVIWESQIKGHQLLQADLGCRLRLDSASLFGVCAIVPFVTGHMADIVRALLCLHTTRNLFLIAPDASVEISMIVDTYKRHFEGLLEHTKDGEIQWPHQV